MKNSRREFLMDLGCALLSRAAICAGAEQLLMMNALAKPSDPPDYKALVCIFMFGGNDANNMVIPYDNYADYAAVRGGTGIAIPQDPDPDTGTPGLLQINPPKAGATFGLHPALGQPDPNLGLSPDSATLYDLWTNHQNVAIITNVGTLIAPVTRDQYTHGQLHPYQLFSHSDQQNAWQTSYAKFPYPTGWAGRTADVLGIDPSGFPTIASVAGVTIFSAGRTTRPIVLPDANTSLQNALKLERGSIDTDDGSALKDLLNQDMNDDGSPTLVNDAAGITAQAIANSLALQGSNDVGTTFPNTGLGRQLHQVARLIKLAKDVLNIRRQIFFCSIGGFDTHNDQGALNFNQGQPSLLKQVS